MVDWLEQLVWMAGELVLTRMVALGSPQPMVRQQPVASPRGKIQALSFFLLND